MSLLYPRTAHLLKNARLGPNVTRFAVPWSALPPADTDRIGAWLAKAGIDPKENRDGWFSISVSEEYGRTLWGPYIAQMPGEPTKAALILGSEVIPFSDVKDFTVIVNENQGLDAEWQVQLEDDSDYVDVPIRKSKVTNPGLKEVRSALQGSDASQVLAEATVIYPKLPSLPVGEYLVIGTFTYQGYNGKTQGLVLNINGSPRRYQGNKETAATLSLDPLISQDNPAKLTILSHGKTAQGYDKVAITFEVAFDNNNSESFNFLEPDTSPLLSPAEEMDFTAEVEVEPVTKRKRSR